jgi:predicted RNA binding protein YcfA (HicA-like mRNA interferase family)
MSKLPSLTGKEVVSLLKKVGFIVERQRGSHVFLKHDDGRATVVPIHSGETIVGRLQCQVLI